LPQDKIKDIKLMWQYNTSHGLVLHDVKQCGLCSAWADHYRRGESGRPRSRNEQLGVQKDFMGHALRTTTTYDASLCKRSGLMVHDAVLNQEFEAVRTFLCREQDKVDEMIAKLKENNEHTQRQPVGRVLTVFQESQFIDLIYGQRSANNNRSYKGHRR
jgi:hypothetical protein